MPPWAMRITLWMPVTPARVSETRTRGAEACTSCRSATSSLAGVVTLRIVRALRCDQLQLPPTTPPVIKRFLRRRHEPRSIFEHIDAHVRPDVAGLTKGGDELPDEAEFSEGGISFAPERSRASSRAGRSRGGRGGVERDLRRAHRARRKTRTPTTRAQSARDCSARVDVRARIDALRDRLNAAPPPHTELLYPELRELFLRSGHRDEVKYSMALLGGFRRAGGCRPVPRRRAARGVHAVCRRRARERDATTRRRVARACSSTSRAGGGRSSRS